MVVGARQTRNESEKHWKPNKKKPESRALTEPFWRKNGDDRLFVNLLTFFLIFKLYLDFELVFSKNLIKKNSWNYELTQLYQSQIFI